MESCDWEKNFKAPGIGFSVASSKKRRKYDSRSEELSKLRSSCMMIFTQFIPNSIKLSYVQERSLQVETCGTRGAHEQFESV